MVVRTPMKFLAAPLCALVLSLPATSMLAQTSTPTKATNQAANDNAGRFSITWKPNPNWELTLLKGQLELMKREAAQGNVPAEQISGLAQRIDHLERHTPPLLFIFSKGGPLSGFVAVASRMKEFSLTLINAAEPADLETPIPSFELRNAHWGTVINVLSTFLETRGLELRFVGGDSANPAEASSIVCMLTRSAASAPKDKRAAQADFESLQLDEYIHGAQTIEVIVDAIRTAWELDPARDPAALRLKFHPGTKLLLVSGPAPAGDIARQIAARLRKKTIDP